MSADDRRSDRSPRVLAPEPGRPAGPGPGLATLPRAAAPARSPAHGPPVARPDRRLRRAPGRLRRVRQPGRGICPAARHALLPLAALPHRATVAAPAPPPPRYADARRRA